MDREAVGSRPPRNWLRLWPVVGLRMFHRPRVLWSSAPAANRCSNWTNRSFIALHKAGFEVAVETNGTRLPPPGIDWICVSPKAGAELVLKAGDELKLVFPQPGAEPCQYEMLDFRWFFLQPMDGPERERNTQLAICYCLDHPRWRLSLQTHKLLNLPLIPAARRKRATKSRLRSLVASRLISIDSYHRAAPSYRPNTSASASMISPTVQRACAASINVGIRFSFVAATRRTSASSRRTASPSRFALRSRSRPTCSFSTVSSITSVSSGFSSAS